MSTEPLTADQLAEIKARLDYGSFDDLHRRLLAEVERLREQVAAAWDEGRAVGIRSCGTLWLADDPPVDPRTLPNPYRPTI